MGLTQHRNSATIERVMNFLFLKGNIGRPGSGACPGEDTATCRAIGPWELRIEWKAFLDDLGRVRLRASARGRPRYGQTIRRCTPAASGFSWHSGSFLRPDRIHRSGTESPGVDRSSPPKLNRSHLVNGQAALILPCLGRWKSTGRLRPPICHRRRQHEHHKPLEALRTRHPATCAAKLAACPE
jgi:hypothetical protein